MVEIIVAAYLIVGSFVALLLWTILISSKRSDESQTMKSDFVKHDISFAPIQEPGYQADRR